MSEDINQKGGKKNNMDYTHEWINFLRSRAEDLEKSLPRPDRYLTPSLVMVIIGIFTGVASWCGELGELWVKLLAGILIAFIFLLAGAVGLIYFHILKLKRNNISTEKDNVITLIAMILGKRVISPEEIYDMWQKCKNKESFEKRKEEIESAFKIKSSSISFEKKR
jgi:hypothetical protein